MSPADIFLYARKLGYPAQLQWHGQLTTHITMPYERGVLWDFELHLFLDEVLDSRLPCQYSVIDLNDRFELTFWKGA